MLQEFIPAVLAVSTQVRDFDLDVDEALVLDAVLQVVGEPLDGVVKVGLVLLENQGLVRLFDVVGEDVRVRQSLPVRVQNVDGLLQELHVHPVKVVLLGQLLHLQLHRHVQLSFQLQ